MITKIEGIIIYTTDYKNTSKIIHVYSKEEGIISIMCKGAKSLKSPLRAGTLKYTYGSFYVYKKDKYILKEVDIINPFLHIHNDIETICYMAYLIDLAKQVYQESNEKSLFNLLILTLEKMNEGLDAATLTNIFEIKVLPLLGVGIELDHCIRCGKTKQIITIDGDVGGYICKNCYQNERIVSLKAIQLLRMYYYVDLHSITKLDIQKQTKEEIDQFLNRYYDRYTGLFLRSKNFLEALK